MVSLDLVCVVEYRYSNVNDYRIELSSMVQYMPLLLQQRMRMVLLNDRRILLESHRTMIVVTVAVQTMHNSVVSCEFPISFYIGNVPHLLERMMMMMMMQFLISC